MALDVGRWVKYAKARIDDAVGRGNRELDRLEAEREAETADRPWLRSDSDAPTLDEARARIEWETRRQAAADHDAPTRAEVGHGSGTDDEQPPAGEPDRPAAAGPAHADPAGSVAGGLTDLGGRGPEELRADADAASARLELEENQRESAARLDAIRRELGIEGPSEPAP